MIVSRLLINEITTICVIDDNKNSQYLSYRIKYKFPVFISQMKMKEDAQHLSSRWKWKLPVFISQMEMKEDVQYLSYRWKLRHALSTYICDYSMMRIMMMIVMMVMTTRPSESETRSTVNDRISSAQPRPNWVWEEAVGVADEFRIVRRSRLFDVFTCRAVRLYSMH